MKLISLTANKSTFHPIYFNDGINIIVGKQVAPHNENDGNTYNGVGKSLTLHLIHLPRRFQIGNLLYDLKLMKKSIFVKDQQTIKVL